MILASLHLDASVAVREAAHIDTMIGLAAGLMALGQRRGEIPKDRDAGFTGAMVIGGMRHAMAAALASDPPIPERTTARRLWVLIAAIMGLDPGEDHP